MDPIVMVGSGEYFPYGPGVNIVKKKRLNNRIAISEN